MVVQIDLNKDLTIEIEFTHIKEDKSVGMPEYCEFQKLSILKGTLVNYTDWLSSYQTKGWDIWESLEHQCLQKINN